MPKFLKGGPNPGFKKGQSGNPRGRPKAIVDVAAAKVEMFTPEHAAQARATLLAIINDPKATASARFSAAQFVYERVHGRTAQQIDLRQQADLKELSDAELLVIATDASLDEETEGGNNAASAPSGTEKPH
jgi:hypothetical protein